jgi:hypothetical protein
MTVIPSRHAVTALVVAALAVTVPAAGAATSPAAGTAPPRMFPPGSAVRTIRPEICGQDWHEYVHGRYNHMYEIRNDYFGSAGQCILNRGDWANFQVVKSGANSHTAENQAFPEIFYGAAWRVVSPGSPLPRHVYNTYNPEVSWHTTEHANGMWNAALDLWFGRHKLIGGQAKGAELMIWINTRKFPVPHGAPVYEIDGTSWWFHHWRACNANGCWNYTQFRRVQPTWNVNKLRLAPFFQLLEGFRLLKARWYLWNVSAGFEIWRGGTGLATTRFWTRVTKPAATAPTSG